MFYLISSTIAYSCNVKYQSSKEIGQHVESKIKSREWVIYLPEIGFLMVLMWKDRSIEYYMSTAMTCETKRSAIESRWQITYNALKLDWIKGPLKSNKSLFLIVLINTNPVQKRLCCVNRPGRPTCYSGLRNLGNFLKHFQLLPFAYSTKVNGGDVLAEIVSLSLCLAILWN